MRKYKEVKRKELIYSLDEWNDIEQKAALLNMKTGTLIKQMSLNGHINVIRFGEIAPLMNALRIIGSNINQLARKANEINSIYAEDYENMKGEYAELCRSLSQYLCELRSIKASPTY